MPFLISSENSKRALNIYRVFRKLSYVNQLGFFEVQKPRESRLFYFQIGRCLAAPFPQPFSFLGRTAFSFSMNNIPCLKKCTGGNGGKSWKIQTKQVPSQTEPDRNTVPTQGLPHRLRSLCVQHPHCVRDAPFPGMVFCARVRTENVCARDWWSYLKRRNPNEYAISQPKFPKNYPSLPI